MSHSQDFRGNFQINSYKPKVLHQKVSSREGKKLNVTNYFHLVSNNFYRKNKWVQELNDIP